MTDLRDWRGTPIEKGCTIVYPGRGSSHLWMNEAVVEEIKELELPYGIGSKPILRVRRTRTVKTHSKVGTVRTIEALDRVTVVPENPVEGTVGDAA